MTQRLSNLYGMQEYLLEAWNGVPKVSHRIIGVSRGPKGSVRAIVIEADGGDQIGPGHSDDNSYIAVEDTSNLDSI